MMNFYFDVSNRPQDVALMHQDTSEDRDVVDAKLNLVFGVRQFST